MLSFPSLFRRRMRTTRSQLALPDFAVLRAKLTLHCFQSCLWQLRRGESSHKPSPLVFPHSPHTNSHLSIYHSMSPLIHRRNKQDTIAPHDTTRIMCEHRNIQYPDPASHHVLCRIALQAWQSAAAGFKATSCSAAPPRPKVWPNVNLKGLNRSSNACKIGPTELPTISTSMHHHIMTSVSHCQSVSI